MSEPKCVNIMQVDDKVLMTIRYPDTDNYYGYDAVYEGSVEDVMIHMLTSSAWRCSATLHPILEYEEE